MSSDADNYQRFGWDFESGAGERRLTEAPALGTEVPGLELPDLEGRHHRLRDYRGHPVVIEFGSYPCPMFCGHLLAMDEGAREHPDTTPGLTRRAARPGRHLLDLHVLVRRGPRPRRPPRRRLAMPSRGAA